MPTRRLGIELPVIQAPMAGVQGPALAIAVSEAGGLGSLPCAMLDQAQLAETLSRIAAATGKPVNVNFFCHAMPDQAPEREERWRELLAPYYREAGIEAPAASPGKLRRPIDAETVDVLERFRPRVVSFHFGLPEQRLLRRIKAWGALVLASATTPEEGRWLQRHGADAVIAQGIEAGGHRGHFLSEDLSLQRPTLALTRELAGALDVPVIAAGGIASPAQVRAALDAGADAVQVGTSYLLCTEATTGEVHRAALQRSRPSPRTGLTNLFSGRPARGIVNRLMRELGPMRAEAPPFPLASRALAPLRTHAEALGRDDFTPLWSGTDTSGCRALPAARLTRELAGV